MKRRWLALLAVTGILVVSILLRDVILHTVILPLAYSWWLLTLYYRAVPQLIVWALLIVIVFISALRNISPQNPFRRVEKKNQKPAMGPVEELSNMLNKVPEGIYYKWLVANRLGNVARELLDQREGRRARGFSRLIGKDWRPPREVGAYLESGLNGSFADFPQSNGWRKPESTPLDVEAKEVIEYLEYEMETSHDRHRKGI
ncbi:MAG TPA: hypothetical protein VFI68_14260 [Anaerolineales bacterium]|nr:hypothetical protein [Anaerolineales bacterium]